MKTLHRVPLFLVVCLVLNAYGTSAFAGEDDEDKTLSPYFAIENGDPSVDRFPLKSTDVEATISGVIANVLVRQTYVNSGTRPINAKYVFPASTRAAVHGMKMTIGEHVITARIREREQAKHDFEAAKAAGKSASLLEQHRPNVFSVDVANVMPGDTIVIELTYSELLVPTDGTYEFVYPTVVGPRYSERPEAGAAAKDTWIKNPYLPEGAPPPSRFNIVVQLATGIPIQELSCPSHKTDAEWDAKNAATVLLSPSETDGGNRDFILKYRLTGKQVQSGLLLYEGDDEKFFLLMAQPPERVRPEAIPPREYVFIVDVSGSMHGFPLNVSKTLLRSLIGNLRPTDTFNVILFSGGSRAMAPASIAATAENIGRAIAVIDEQSGGGGTRLHAAVAQALAMPATEGCSRSFIIVTDGYIGAEREVFSLIRDNLNRANVFAFGIGSSVNRHLIEGIARAGNGEPFVVTDSHEAGAKAAAFREYVQSPVLTDVAIAYDGFDAYDVQPASIPDLLAQRPLLIFGKWRGTTRGSISIKGLGGDGPYSQTFSLNDTKPLAENRPLRYLWARTRVAELSDFNFGATTPEVAREVTTLGLTYDLLTEYTSFVAVHEVVRNAEASDGATDVKQPLPLPKGVSDLAVGGGSGSAGGPSVSNPMFQVSGASEAPEPELWLLLVLLAAGGAVVALRRRNRVLCGVSRR